MPLVRRTEGETEAYKQGYRAAIVDARDLLAISHQEFRVWSDARLKSMAAAVVQSEQETQR